MDGERKMERNFGKFSIRGELIGGKMELLGNVWILILIFKFNLIRIRRGTDESNIESMVISNYPFHTK
jgi:hypothetical protein